MVEPRPPASDPCDIDLTDAESFRNGFPHEVFSRLRREAPVWWPRFPDPMRETTDEWLRPTTFGPLSIWNPVMVAPREIAVRLT